MELPASDLIPDVQSGTEAVPASFADVPWRWGDVVVGLGIFAIGWIVSLAFGEWLKQLPRALVLVVGIGFYLWLLVFPVLVARRRCPGFAPRLPRFGKLLEEALLAPFLLLGLWAILLVALTLWSLVSPVQPRNPLMESLAEGPPSPAAFIILLATFLLAPVVEEVFFRGFLYNALRRYVLVLGALVVQAVAFGVFHTYSLAYVLATTVMGLFFGLVYEWRKTLLAPILLHTLQNFAASAIVVGTMLANASAPVLGVSGEPDAQGCRITHVFPGSAAEKMGLQPGDVVTAIDGTPIRTFDELRAAVRKHEIGARVRVEYLREGKALSAEAELGARTTR